MRIQFLPEARKDARRLYSFLENINPQAGGDALKAIRDSIYLLSKNPELGRMFDRASGLRRWIVRFGRNGYVVEYFVEDNTLFISRIWHTREAR